MDLKEKYGLDVSDEDLRANIRRVCLKIRVSDVLFYVPFGQVENFLKMALSGSNDITLFHGENSDLALY